MAAPRKRTVKTKADSAPADLAEPKKRASDALYALFRMPLACGIHTTSRYSGTAPACHTCTPTK